MNLDPPKAVIKEFGPVGEREPTADKIKKRETIMEVTKYSLGGVFGAACKGRGVTVSASDFE